MYRSMSPIVIYCTDAENCDLKCGRFHKSKSAESKRKKMGVLKTKQLSSLDIPTTSTLNTLTPSPSRLSVSTSNHSAEPPHSPFSMASTVTLDDIIASARRKVSADYQPILLPSPIFLDEDPVSEIGLIVKNNRKRHDSESSSHGVADIEDEFVRDLMDSDTEDDFWYSGDPPSMILDDDLADFDELLKVTKPPKDHFSNPIERGADPLNKRRKNVQKSSNNLNVDDDNSSVDFSVADVRPHESNIYKNFPMMSMVSSGNQPEYEGNL